MYQSAGSTLQLGDQPSAFTNYRDRLMKKAGNPSDPFEIMLIEQVALAHLNIGRLHYECAMATDVDRIKVFGTLAVALTGEMRRTVLALKTYRGEIEAPAGITPGRSH
jgi:hypothetical protein